MGGKGSVRQGRQGEEYAACFLKEHGYRILASNFCTKQGEIDLIAENGEYLAFIEVKTRRRIVSRVSSGIQGKTGKDLCCCNGVYISVSSGFTAQV